MAPLLVVGAACGRGAGGDGDDETTDTTGSIETEAGEASGPAVVGGAPPASGGIPSVVTLEPIGHTPEGAGTFPPPVVDQFGLAFRPAVLIVPAGTPVTFTNSEGALVHNVHVRSIEGDSTLVNGDAAPGEELSVTFPAAGGYDVLCDMHPGMTSFVYVTDAPFATAAGTDGRFRMADVPPGSYAARVWTAAGGLGPATDVTVTEGTTEVDLTDPGG